MTNDVNLNKLAGVQGVPVVNLNDVANALRPRFIPGEHVRIRIIKEGESPGQGVGYLDDGTMVVVDQGSREIGQEMIRSSPAFCKTAPDACCLPDGHRSELNRPKRPKARLTTAFDPLEQGGTHTRPLIS